MDITPAIAAGKQVIQSYGVAGFRIAGAPHLGPVLVTPDEVFAWSVTDFAALTGDDFKPLLACDPAIEVILLGCGATGRLIPSRLRIDLKAMGLSIDAMDTGAACRTYNVMLSEDRRVAAALLVAYPFANNSPT